MTDQEGGCRKEVAKRIEKAWNRWRELTDVLCDKKIPTKLKVLHRCTEALMYSIDVQKRDLAIDSETRG